MFNIISFFTRARTFLCKKGVIRSQTLAGCLLSTLVLLLSPIAVQANHRVCFTGFRILNEAPILIPCGGVVTLNCQVDYVRDHVDFFGGCCFRDGEGARNFTAQLHDDDNPWGWELYGEAAIVVPQAPATGTIDFNIDVVCTFDDDCEDCLVNGDEHEAELFITIKGCLFGGGIKIARCYCGTCPTGAGMNMHDFAGYRGMMAATPLTNSNTIQAVRQYAARIYFDSLSYNFASLMFSDPVVQANTFVMPFPGGVNLLGFFNPPHNFATGLFATLGLFINPAAPLAETWLSFDSLSTFIDSNGMVIPVCLVDGKARTLPADGTAPVINDQLVNYTECSLSGMPGSIADTYLDSIPDYVYVEAYQDTNYMGPVPVLPDGSFEFPRPQLPFGSMVLLVATDRAGNADSALIGPAGVCCIPRGNVNGDQAIDVVDIVCLIQEVFFQNCAYSPPEAGNVNCDATTDVVDIVALIGFVFFGAPTPCCL